MNDLDFWNSEWFKIWESLSRRDYHTKRIDHLFDFTDVENKLIERNKLSNDYRRKGI
jgi:hypothetical protein